jgi:hypothetical protein
MTYPTTVTFKGAEYDTELDYQFNYLYALGEIDYFNLLDELGIEYDPDEDQDDILQIQVVQDIPEDELQTDDF